MKHTVSVNVLVYGAGAIGTYFGGSLAQAGHKVTFIEQPKVADDLNQRGLTLDLRIDPRRKESLPLHLVPGSFDCYGSLEQALGKGPFDAAIFALKSFDTVAALQSLQPFKDQLPPVLCLQNGVENETAIAAVLGANKVLYGTTTHSVARQSAGSIVLERCRGVGLAPGADKALQTLAGDLAEAMNEAWLNARLYPRPADMKWSKMLTNLLGNATAAILDMTPAEVFQNQGLFKLEMGMMQETLLVMEALGIHPVNLPGVPVSLLSWAVFDLPASIAKPLMVKLVGGGRGGKMPSFHIDLHSGRGRSEVDYLNGAVVRAGERVRVATPINRLLNQTLMDLVAGKQEVSTYSRHPEKLLSQLGK